MEAEIRPDLHVWSNYGLILILSLIKYCAKAPIKDLCAQGTASG